MTGTSITPNTTVLWASMEEQHTSWLADVAQARCPECGSRVGECYFICSRSPEYYSPEQERWDSMWQDAMSDDEHRRAAHAEYELVYGPECGPEEEQAA